MLEPCLYPFLNSGQTTEGDETNIEESRREEEERWLEPYLYPFLDMASWASWA